MQDHFHNHLTQHLALAQAVQAQLGPAVHDAATLLMAAFSQGHKVLLCGNGGSAADAQHLAAELTGRYEVTDRRALPALALTTDTSALTAIGNDLGFDRVFARQVEALGQPGDVLIGISTSGHSPNVIAAVEQARRQGLKTIGLLGRDGGALAPLVDLAITIPSQRTAHIQEMHITLAHILCGLIDAAFLAPSLNAELDQGTVRLGPSDAALRPQAPAAAYATDTGTLSSTAAAPGALFPHP